MTTNLKAFKRSLPIIASALGKRHGVNVVISSDLETAGTDGKDIYLPALPESNEALILGRGYLDHEIAHIRETDFDVWHTLKGLQRGLVNIVEDIRIENLMGLAYPGAKINLLKLEEYFVQNQVYGEPLTNESHPISILERMLHHNLRYTVLDHQCTAELAKNAMDCFLATFPDRAADAIIQLLPAVPNLKSTFEVAEFVNSILSILRNEIDNPSQGDENINQPEQSGTENGEPEQGESKSGESGNGEPKQGDSGNGEPKQGDSGNGEPEQGDSGNGEPEQGDSGNGEPEQGDSGNGEPEQGDSGNGEPEQGDSGNGEPKQGESGNGEPKQGDSGNGEPEQGESGNGEPKQGESGNGEPKQGDSGNGEPKQGESGNGNGKSNNSGSTKEACKKVFSDDGMYRPERLGDQADLIKESIGQMVIETPAEKRVIRMPVVADAPKHGRRVSPGRVKANVNALTTRLRALVEAHQRENARPASSGIEIDSSRLHMIPTGATDVFHGHSDERKVNTGVIILVDQSSSMAKNLRSRIATECSLGTALALERIKGVQLSVAGFSTRDTEMSRHQPVIRPMKNFSDPLNASKFRAFSGGLTPMEDALWWAGSQIAQARDVQRHIVIMITDGLPNDVGATIHVAKKLKSAGVELNAIGINVDIDDRIFPSNCSVTDVSQLSKEVFKMMKRGLLAA